MSRTLYPSADAIGQALKVAKGPATHADPPPPSVLDWLARLRLLEGVPFAYLVPDERLLPPESIRFFFLDRNWVDAAVDGALAVGAGSSRERAHLRARHKVLRDAVDALERNIWASAARKDKTTYAPAPAETVTGFLLRSRAVSGWPGLHVRATRAGGDVRLLRFERLAPAVLLVLFDGWPDQVTIEEPRQGLQFGFDPGQTVEVEPTTSGQPGRTVKAPFRPNAPGVVDVRALLNDMQGGTGTSAGLALQLVQSPYQQVFTTEKDAPAFISSITLADLDAAFKEPS